MMMLHSNDDNTVLRPLFADFTQILSDYWTIICDLSICEHVCVCFKELFYELREERKYFHFQIFKVFLFKMFKGITKSKAKFQLPIVYMECKFMIIFTLSFASYCLFRPSTRNVWIDLRPYKYDEFDGTSLARYLYLKFKINRHC